jgi:hypothetical protein
VAYVPAALRSKKGKAYVPVALRSKSGTAAQRAFVKKHGGPNFFDRLGSDIGAAAVGVFPGLYGAGRSLAHDVKEQPWSLAMGPAAPLWAVAAQGGKGHVYKKVAKPIAKSYAYTYGPAFRGDFGKTGSRISEHPLGPILDAISLASLGAGSYVKAASLLGKDVSAARSLGLIGPGGKVVTKPVTGTELSRRMRLGANRAMKAITREDRYFGEELRAARLERKQLNVRDAQRKARLEPHAEATTSLRKRELKAVNLRKQFLTAAEVRIEAKRMLALDDPIAHKNARSILNPKVLALVDKPSKRMLRELETADPATDYAGKLVGLPEATAARRAWQPLLVSRGARYENLPLDASLGESLLGRSVLLNEKQGRLVKIANGEATVRFGKRSKSGKSQSYTKTAPLDDLRATTQDLVPPPGKTIEGMVDELRAEFPGREPQYVPHASVAERAPRGSGAGGGRAKPRPAYRQNKAVLQMAGRIAYHADTLGPNLMKKLRVALRQDVYDTLIAHGTELPVGAKKAVGWEYIGKKPGYLQRTAGELDEALDEIVDLEDPGLSGFGDDVLAKTEDAAEVGEGGGYIVVPTKFANTIVGEFTRNNTLVARFFREVTVVWRALVLNLRVAWLVNNIAGNTLLYAFKHAGPSGLRAYLRAVGEDTPGLRKMLDDSKHMTPEEIGEVWADHLSGGTFYGSQTPTSGGVAGILNARYSPARWARKIDVGYEKKLRRAALREGVERSPEARAIYKRMDKESRSIREASKQALDENPELAARVSKTVHDTMGDFFGMSDFERRYVRSVAPFYAWYRAITLVMLKMPLDAPYRTAILAKIGQLGAEMDEDFGLPFLGGAIPTGELNEVVKTRGANPYSTPVDLFRSGSSFANAQWSGIPRYGDPYETEAFLGNINPLLAAPFLRGQKGVVEALPFYRLAFPRKSSLYSPSVSRQRELWSYLGFPKVTVNPAEARRRQSRYR